MGAVSLTCPILPGTTFICGNFFWRAFCAFDYVWKGTTLPPRPPGVWEGSGVAILSFNSTRRYTSLSRPCVRWRYTHGRCVLYDVPFFFLKKKTGEGFELPNDDLKKVSVSYLFLQQRPTYIQTEGVVLLVGVLTSGLTILFSEKMARVSCFPTTIPTVALSRQKNPWKKKEQHGAQPPGRKSKQKSPPREKKSSTTPSTKDEKGTQKSPERKKKQHDAQHPGRKSKQKSPPREKKSSTTPSTKDEKGTQKSPERKKKAARRPAPRTQK